MEILLKFGIFVVGPFIRTKIQQLEPHLIQQVCLQVSLQMCLQVLETSLVLHVLEQRRPCEDTDIAVQHGGQVIYYEAQVILR
jgi:hypothetical protein